MFWVGNWYLIILNGFEKIDLRAKVWTYICHKSSHYLLNLKAFVLFFPYSLFLVWRIKAKFILINESPSVWLGIDFQNLETSVMSRMSSETNDQVTCFLESFPIVAVVWTIHKNGANNVNRRVSEEAIYFPCGSWNYLLNKQKQETTGRPAGELDPYFFHRY